MAIKNTSLANTKIHHCQKNPQGLDLFLNGNHYKDSAIVSDILVQKEFAMAQDKLLFAMTKFPEKYLELDCDKLSFNLTVSDADYKQLSNQISKIKTAKRQEILKVKIYPVDDNSTSKKLGNLLVYKRCDLSLVTNLENSVSVFLGMRTGKQYGVRVEFTPSKFSDDELNTIFHHIQTVLGKTRYKQVMTSAKVSRVDIGCNLAGIYKPIIALLPKYKSIRTCNSYPNRDTCPIKYRENSFIVTESYYCGSMKSSHCVVYDKGLESEKKGIGHTKPTTRIEYRYLVHKSGKSLKLNGLASLEPRLQNYWFIAPWVFKRLTKETINILICNQGLSSIKEGWLLARHELIKASSELKGATKKRKARYSIKNSWLKDNQAKILNRYQDIVINPKR
jgi:hypothetical protein